MIRSLELSYTRLGEEHAPARSVEVIEDFLEQLDGDAQADMLASLLSGESLIAKYGEEQGRELAAYRLALLMESIGKAAHDLSDVEVFDVVVPNQSTYTHVELAKAGRL